MPNPVMTRRVLLGGKSIRGLPRLDALYAAFDLVADNLLPQSEDLTNATYWARSNTGTASAAPVPSAITTTLPDGTTGTAYRVVLDRGADVGSFSLLRDLALSETVQYTMGVWFKSYDANTYTCRIGTLSGANTIGVMNQSIAPTWANLVDTCDVGLNVVRMDIGVVQADGNGQTADIVIWHPQLNGGTTLRPYRATTDLQTWASLYGRTPTIQRGSTTGAEASDPKTRPTGWGCETDDRGQSGTLTGLGMSTFSVLFTGLANGTVGTLFSLADAGVEDQFIRVLYNASGVVQIGAKKGAAAETLSATLAVSTTAQSALWLTSDGTTLTLTRQDTGVSVTLANPGPTGAPRLMVGATGKLTVGNLADAMTASAAFPWGVNLSPGQQAQGSRWAKQYMLSNHEVTIS